MMSFQEKVFKIFHLSLNLAEASLGLSRASALSSREYLELQLYLHSIALLKNSETELPSHKTPSFCNFS